MDVDAGAKGENGAGWATGVPARRRGRPRKDPRLKKRRHLEYVVFGYLGGTCINRNCQERYEGATLLEIVDGMRYDGGPFSIAMATRQYCEGCLKNLSGLGVDPVFPEGWPDSRIAQAFMLRLVGVGMAVRVGAKAPRKPSMDAETRRRVTGMGGRASKGSPHDDKGVVRRLREARKARSEARARAREAVADILQKSP